MRDELFDVKFDSVPSMSVEVILRSPRHFSTFSPLLSSISHPSLAMTSLLSRPASSSTRILPSFTSPHRTFAPLALSRAFSTSTPPPQPPSTSSKDPSHPYLWYHQLTNPPRIALSFLASTPRNGSTTVLGYLGGGPDSGLNDFRQEPRFMYVILHLDIPHVAEMW